MSQLDMELVGRIARDEARRLRDQMWDFMDYPAISGPLSERYVELYLEAPEELVAPIAGRPSRRPTRPGATSSRAARPDGPTSSWSGTRSPWRPAITRART